MMLYALRWPIYRSPGVADDEAADSFFRTLANLVAEALDHEAPLSLPSSHDPPLVAAAMAYTKEHLQSVTLAEVCRAVAVSERTLRRQFQSEAQMLGALISCTPGCYERWPCWRRPPKRAAGRQRGGLRQRGGVVHPGLQSVLRGGNPVVIPKACHRYRCVR